ncbi:alpha/beta hydrolase [Lacisediminihabitans changchengi]|uniref:Dienelactone hydrolase family protein n=1 Tax=Lacisediminihabitans changchengi TaxID=2787634 RepID=A0A934SJ04_9MICO|nr:alpha/beta fold hydrolase [Lacisediminihabitans changchengi]MBK4347572.1 dienelactone hydrolase family protein [Lacisediminihabitans changchengi]
MSPGSSALTITGAVWSVAAEQRVQALASRPLLVLMHGRGSNERDLASLAPLLPAELVTVSLRAPLPLGDGYSWFPPAEPGLPAPTAAAAATDAVLAFLDSLPPTGQVGLLGFSQGGAMVTHLLRSEPERFAAGVVLSGFSLAGELPGDAVLASLRPPVFWGRDVADPVISPDAIDRTAAWLPVHSTAVVREYPGVGHSISREELDDVTEFLEATLI